MGTPVWFRTVQLPLNFRKVVSFHVDARKDVLKVAVAKCQGAAVGKPPAALSLRYGNMTGMPMIDTTHAHLRHETVLRTGASDSAAPAYEGVGFGRSPYLCSISERLAVRHDELALVITDARKADDPIVFVNNAFQRLMGYERDELMGRNPRMFRGPETSPEVVRILREAVKAARPARVDILSYTRRGGNIWTRLRLRPLFDGNHRLRSFVGIHTPLRASEVNPGAALG